MAILDGGPITAAGRPRSRAWRSPGSRRRISGRAAERSPDRGGVAGPQPPPGDRARAAGARLTIHDRHADRAEALAADARATPGIDGAVSAPTARDATVDADVVVTAAAFTDPEHRQRDDERLAGSRRPRRPDRLRDDAVAEVARDARALPRRRSRPVPRQSGGRPVRRLSGSRRDARARRSSRPDPVRATAASWSPILGSGSPTSSSATPSCDGPCELGLGTTLPR